MDETGPDIEFASKEWLDAAREILNRLAEGSAAELRGVAFSVCEVFTDTPPHLGWPDRRFAWHLRLVDGEVEVATGKIDDADMSVSAAYHLVLPIARTVYAGDPAAAMRARREAAHRAGLPGGGATSTGITDPALGRVLGGLHDELARRTKDDPDLTGRTAAYGLTEPAERLDSEGWVRVAAALSPAFTAELADAVGAGTPPGDHPLVAEAAGHPWLTTLVEHALGGPGRWTGAAVGEPTAAAAVGAVVLGSGSAAGDGGTLLVGTALPAGLIDALVLTLGFEKAV
jgi:hypothetical protein